MDAECSERKPAGSDIPAWARKARGINSDNPRVNTVSFDEMWTRLGARRGENGQSAWIWTAAVEEWDGGRRADFEVEYRDAETFMRLLRRLPEAAKYGSDRANASSYKGCRIRCPLFIFGFGWRVWLQPSGFPLSRE